MVSLEFFIDIKSYRSHYGPGVDSASKRNEYQEYFLEGKGGWCVRLTTLPPSCVVVTKSGNLNFLEPSGHLGVVMGLIYLLYTVNSNSRTANCQCRIFSNRNPAIRNFYISGWFTVQINCTGLFEMTVGVLTTCHLILQKQQHVISFYGVT